MFCYLLDGWRGTGEMSPALFQRAISAPSVFTIQTVNCCFYSVNVGSTSARRIVHRRMCLCVCMCAWWIGAARMSKIRKANIRDLFRGLKCLLLKKSCVTPILQPSLAPNKAAHPLQDPPHQLHKFSIIVWVLIKVQIKKMYHYYYYYYNCRTSTIFKKLKFNAKEIYFDYFENIYIFIFMYYLCIKGANNESFLTTLRVSQNKLAIADSVKEERICTW